ncbi:MAG: hypothetical protein HQL65_00905 [Magnetococcales bacterium]|nr:hypothetical protein [Magnetococcales bacterium]
MLTRSGQMPGAGGRTLWSRTALALLGGASWAAGWAGCVWAASPPAASPIPVDVPALSALPQVDGELADWGDSGWTDVEIKPAKENDADNVTGVLKVRIKAGVAGERFFFAARWPDPEASTLYRPWKLSGTQYKRSKLRDDMFVVRFDMGGTYDECMLSRNDYRVDLWQWSAGRTNPAGLAEDFMHVISATPQENAAEYEHPEGGMVYIRKIRDAGKPIYDNLDAPAQPNGETLPGIQMLKDPSGSLADVTARGVWKDGHWHLELSRKLNTGHGDDVNLTALREIRGAIAVFNKGFAEHKSVSGTLLFRFPSR